MMQVLAGFWRKFLHIARVAVETVVSRSANNDAPVIIAAIF